MGKWTREQNERHRDWRATQSEQKKWEDRRAWRHYKREQYADPEYQKRYRARQAVYKAEREGVLVRPTVCAYFPCVHPGEDCMRIEASHEDYSEPLRVTYLCVQCHRLKDSGWKVTFRSQYSQLGQYERALLWIVHHD